MPSSVPAATRLSANGLAHSRITAHGHHEQADDGDAPAAVGQLPEGGGGADQVGLFHVAVAELVEVEAEPGQQRQPEHQVDVAGRGYDERDHTGDQQEPEFDPIGGLQRQASRYLVGAGLRATTMPTNTTTGQPRPISSRLDPVMLAAAYWV